MAYSYVTRSGDGSNKTFTFSFEGQDEGYIRDEDISVAVEGTEVPFTFTSSNTIETLDAPPSGEDNVIIRRSMPRGATYADFRRGNNFGQEVLNNSFLQLLYLVQELMDGFFPPGTRIREAITMMEDLDIEGDLTVRGSTVLEDTLDVDGKVRINNEAEVEASDQSNPKSVLNVEEGDNRYKEPLLQEVDRLDKSDSAIRRDYQAADSAIRRDYQAADSALHNKISGSDPLEASAFSPISWHDQSIDVSVEIPEGKNAWSFGPTITVGEGQSVTVGNGSYWTIANGEVNK